MGLAEKRAIEKFKKGEYVDFTNKVKEITKLDVVIETNWDELGKQIEGRSSLDEDLKDYFTNIFGKTILDSLSSICADDMGKEALSSSLKRIVIKSDSDARSSETGFSFEDGDLILNMTYANTDQVEARTKEMIRLIENRL
ncbi:MAG: hypothetical protein WA705_04315 [Candidatus Ozemobacteraceae bacterium]